MWEALVSNEKITAIFWIIIIGLLFGKITEVVFKKLNRSKWNQNNKNTLVFKFMYRVVIVVILSVCVFQIIMTLAGSKSNLSTLLASSGVITVVLGLAAQESLGNIISGFFIMLFKPFVIGDRIVLASSNITGYVEDITLRHTIIRTYFNSRYIIPNSKMNSEIIENSSLIDARAGMYLDVTIAMEGDLEKAIKVIQDIIAKNENVLDIRTEEEKKAKKPVSSVTVRNISLYGIELRSSVWCENVDISFSVLSALRIQIINQLKKENIPLAKLTFVNFEK